MPSKELSKTYDAKLTEKNIYSLWEKSGFFNPDNLPFKTKKRFVISMPPANVTGELHIGHARYLTLEDIMTRYHRMKQEKALWLPGTDHAGISTQVMVERLLKKEGINRRQIGREAFLKHVWQWKEKYGGKILEQYKSMGASCDWSRNHFTMDPQLTDAVNTAFIKLFNDGLIYRDYRITNWCPRCYTALSDLEVSHETVKSSLWYIRYPIIGTAEQFIEVATTRPETMLGDTAVAVNPKDKRYKKLVGKKVLVPLINREIPIVADAQVDIAFGTGAVKVTPAHDDLDFQIAKRNDLPIVQVIGLDGKMTKEASESFFGLKILDAREKVLARLTQHGFLTKTEEYEHAIAHCERCHATIEPMATRQWFVKMKDMAREAVKAVKTGKIKIVPKRFEKIYFHFLNNIRDWCISRQLWWGHQIPIWYCEKCGETIASAEKPVKCSKCQSSDLKQDEDTLDTWFSSSLWTFSTLGWPASASDFAKATSDKKASAGKPKKTGDLAMFHPTDVMETGWDILFFWVARMTMMSLYLLKEVPFKTVYLHGLILDKDGKKMSKSKGTGVDPLLMTDKYGTDAIRLSLIMGISTGQDMKMYEEKIGSARNFCNKLWNISRFTFMSPKPKVPAKAKTLADQWILSELNTLIKEVTTDLDKFEFSQATEKLYEFTWHKFADWYLEISKVEKNYAVLYHVLETLLKLLHPFIPFVTEEIWQNLNQDKMLMIAEWPRVGPKSKSLKAVKDFQNLQKTIIELRDLKKSKSLKPGDNFVVQKKKSALLAKNKAVIEWLSRAKLELK
ncbi:MAG: valine--tRNA ligase [Patescibacteria group bacterium]